MAKAKREIGENVKVAPGAGKDDALIITKLQAVSRHSHIKVNTLAKKYLHEKCDEYLAQHNLTLDSAQSAKRAD